MKNLSKILISFLVLSMIVLCVNAQRIDGSGTVIEVERAVDEFTSVKVNNGWDLILKQGDTHKLVIVADDNIIETLITEVSGGVLKIYSDEKIGNTKKREIYLTFKELNSIEANGGSDIDAETKLTAEELYINANGGSDINISRLACKKLGGVLNGGSDADIAFESAGEIDLNANGGSDIALKGIQAEKCSLDINGGSDAELQGSVNKLKINANGGSDIEAFNFQVKDAIVYLNGSSDAELNVTGTLDIRMSGGSDVECKGSPEIIHKDICKSCEFSRR